LVDILKFDGFFDAKFHILKPRWLPTRVPRVKFSAYVVAGIIVALAGWVLIGRIGGADPQSGTTVNLDSITAVVIGGTSLIGGRGSIVGAVFGAVIVTALRSGLLLVGVDALYQDLAVGVLIVVALGLDQWIKLVRAMPDKTSTEPSGAQPVLAARSLIKTFGRVVGLDGADFDLNPHEILAVIGDNGAGKSTLIKCLTGAMQPDEGVAHIDGRPVAFRRPQDARDAGIETVYQTLAVAPALDIGQNIYLGRERRASGILGKVFRKLDKAGMMKDAELRMAQLGIGTLQNMRQTVETLSGGQRQAVAVARAVVFASKVIVLNEPVATMGVKESRQVLDLILRLRDKGLPVILVSHNMPHVFELADRIHVQRLGRRVAVISPRTHSMTDAIAIMTGAATP